MIVRTSIFALPLLILVWSLDLYVFLACLRLLLARFRGPRTRSMCLWLQQATDFLPARVCQWIALRRRRYPPPWLPWVVVIMGCLVVRHLVIRFVVEVL